MKQHQHAYMLIDVVREPQPGFENVEFDAAAEPESGDIVFHERRLTPEERITIDGGHVRWYATAGYLGSWPAKPGGSVELPYGQARLIELVQTGIRGDAAIKPRLIGLADAIIEAIEDSLMPISDDDRSDLIASAQRLRDAAVHKAR